MEQLAQNRVKPLLLVIFLFAHDQEDSMAGLKDAMPNPDDDESEPASGAQWVALPPAMLAAVGDVVVRFSALDYEINRLVWKLASVSGSVGACMTLQIPSIPLRMKALISLATLKGCSAGTIKKLNQFAERADALSRQRNRIAHDQWFGFSGNALADTLSLRFELTADKKLKVYMKHISIESLNELSQKITVETNLLLEIRESILSELAAQRE